MAFEDPDSVDSPRGSPRVPPIALVITSVLSVQCGAALATHLFHAAGPPGAALLRLAFSAAILLAVWRPDPRTYDRPALVSAALLGVTLATLNMTFYLAIERIPLGICVALEFVGPLSLAVVGARRSLDYLWAAIAATGIILLTPWGGLHLDSLGVLLALVTGVFWAFYILLAVRVGRQFPGGRGLSIAVAVGAIATAPLGIASAGWRLVHPDVLAVGLGVALLSSALPYSLEIEALRSLPARVFGVLASTQPAVGAIVGFIFLHQVLGLRAVIAIMLVVAASAGAAAAHSAQQQTETRPAISTTSNR